ncbi:MAG: RNA-binding protein [bacterium]|nr:RNA-binding protein [bacterium]
MSAKVFVGNLNFYTTQGELTDLLSEAGSIVDVYLPADRVTGRPRGFAFVEFSSEAESAKAIETFDGYELGGRNIRINAAEDRPQRSGPRPFRPSAPGGGGGDAPGGGGRPYRPKGSRRGKRAQKRSL